MVQGMDLSMTEFIHIHEFVKFPSLPNLENNENYVSMFCDGNVIVLSGGFRWH